MDGRGWGSEEAERESGRRKEEAAVAEDRGLIRWHGPI